MIAKDSKASKSMVDLVEGVQDFRDLCKAAGLETKKVKKAAKLGYDAIARGGSWRRHEDAPTETEGPATQIMRSEGFTIGSYEKRVAHRRHSPESRADTMEKVVKTIKSAYYPHGVNVAAWDAALNMEKAEFEGLVESGTAKSAAGLVHRYAVFWGRGGLKWTGGLETGVPEVGCAGNVHMGPDAVWFGTANYVR